MIRAGLVANTPDEKILEQVHTQFPGSTATKKDIQYYRWEAKQSTGPEGAPLAILYALRALMVTSTGTEQNKLRKWLREHLYVGGLTYVLIKLFKSQGPFQ